ncbi:MAG: hypothetical protein MJ105_09180 [Lachnospiraceae bacterium]|nr:hypothetical protein [Lachnospiraceae bacterium]
MNNEELLDILYDNGKDTLTAVLKIQFAQSSMEEIEDFVSVFGKLCQIAQYIGLQGDYLTNILCQKDSALLNEGSFSEFLETYEEGLKQFLLDVISCRQHICIIKRNDEIPGLASHIITNIGQVVSALSQGKVPVIDTRNCKNSFTALSQAENRNIWEKYFIQPCKLSLDEVEEHMHISYAEGIPGFYPSYKMDDLDNPILMQFWRNAASKYLRFSDYMESKLAVVKDALDWEHKRVLGVICRGTDYTELKPYNHPVQPNPVMVIEDAKQLMEQYKCDYCYLATEDEKIYKQFQDAFGERLLFTQRFLYKDVKGTVLNKYNEQNAIDSGEKNEEYLISLKLLAECCCFIGGRTSGSVVAAILSKGFDFFYLYDEGRYGIDNLNTLKSYIC